MFSKYWNIYQLNERMAGTYEVLLGSGGYFVMDWWSDCFKTGSTALLR